MQQFNIKNSNTIEDNYSLGLLPQRNNKELFYFETSSRSNLADFNLSSENRRILRKTDEFTFKRIPLKDFSFTLDIQKQIFSWIKKLGWEFPISSIKSVFTNHIFNYLYVWKTNSGEIIAYSICYFSSTISHIAYVFYNPDYSHGNLPIRLVLQTVIDSKDLNLKYCYLGRFSETTGYYKRNMPGFQYFDNQQWIDYNKSKLLGSN
jgi:arginyl-tRNA--protein-N-Asp/Glu arginylyltransferase